MAKIKQFLTSRLTRSGDLVKAKITALGIRHKDLADAARISKPRLTAVIQGKTQNPSLRHRVVTALRDLSGCRGITAQWLFEEAA